MYVLKSGEIALATVAVQQPHSVFIAAMVVLHVAEHVGFAGRVPSGTLQSLLTFAQVGLPDSVVWCISKVQVYA
jgi:L-cystine uptake protein TcyP (sodium:dicarboxylate symporter family)